MHNHSLLINDEFNFYQKLTHKMQTELITQLFGSIVDKFSYFFKSLEQAFCNEIIINLQMSITQSGECIYEKDQPSSAVYFIT